MHGFIGKHPDGFSTVMGVGSGENAFAVPVMHEMDPDRQKIQLQSLLQFRPVEIQRKFGVDIHFQSGEDREFRKFRLGILDLLPVGFEPGVIHPGIAVTVVRERRMFRKPQNLQSLFHRLPAVIPDGTFRMFAECGMAMQIDLPVFRISVRLMVCLFLNADTS